MRKGALLFEDCRDRVHKQEYIDEWAETNLETAFLGHVQRREFGENPKGCNSPRLRTKKGKR